MKVSAEDHEAIRLALLKAFVVETGLPHEMVQLLDQVTKATSPKRKLLDRLRR